MREAIVAYDRKGTEIWACANVDSRAYKEVIQLREGNKNLEKQFYDILGQTFSLGAVPRLLWIKNNRPDIYDKIDKINMLSDWIIYKLSGGLCSEPSNAGTSGIFSLKEGCWSSDILKKSGIKDSVLPPSVAPATVLAPILPQIAEEILIDPKAKIICANGLHWYRGYKTK